MTEEQAEQLVRDVSNGMAVYDGGQEPKGEGFITKYLTIRGVIEDE